MKSSQIDCCTCDTGRYVSCQILVDWIHVDREVALKSFEIGKNSWPDSAIASDAAIKLLVDQTLAEIKPKRPVSLDMVRDWSFA
jgi:hypothetical protein